MRATTLVAALGDRLGLFKALGTLGAVTSSALAAHAGVSERYTREWLGGMAAAGYITYEPVAGRFTLPPEHAPALAEEGGPFFVGGPYQLILAEIGQLSALVEAFKTGGGVPPSAYDAGLWEGQERFGLGWVDHLLTQVWLPEMPKVQARLERGAAVADIGCGRGRALIKLAQAYPNSYFVGYDVFAPVIAQATANAQAAGVADRVRFQHLDATQGLPAQYDLIEDCTFENTSPGPNGTRYVGQAAVRAAWEEFFRSSPHAVFEIEEIFACGDRAAVRWLYRWQEANGTPGHVRGVDVLRVRDRKVAESLAYVKG